MDFSIIIPAYDAVEWIEDCLYSITNQDYFINNNKYEIIVGVDGCKDTFKKLKSIYYKYPNLKIYFFKENRGTYVTKNTLIKKTKYNNLILFDADDIMCKDMVTNISKQIIQKNCDALRFKFINFYDSLFNDKNNITKHVSCGVIYIKKNVLLDVNGYRDWVCGADSELFIRLDKYAIYTTNDIYFYRRIHPKSLTQSDETNFKSKIRVEYRKFMKEEQKTLTNPKLNKLTINTKNKLYVPSKRQKKINKTIEPELKHSTIVEELIEIANKNINIIKNIKENTKTEEIVKIQQQNTPVKTIDATFLKKHGDIIYMFNNYNNIIKHIKNIILKARDNNINKIIILNDNIDFGNINYNNFEQYLKTIPIECDVCVLGAYFKKPFLGSFILTKNTDFKKIKGFFQFNSLHAIMIRESLYDYFIENINENTTMNEFYVLINKIIKNDTVYISTPLLFDIDETKVDKINGIDIKKVKEIHSTIIK